MNANQLMISRLAAKLRKRANEFNEDGARLNGINKLSCAATMWKAAQMLRLVAEDLENG